MLKSAAENVCAAFDLLLGSLADGEAAMRQAGAKDFLDGSGSRASGFATKLERWKRLSKQIEAQRTDALEALRDESESQAARSDSLGCSDRSMSASPDAATFTMSYNGARARAVESGSGCLLLAGSDVKRKAWPSLSKSQSRQRVQSERDGTLILTADRDILKLTRDLRFTSKSAAAVFVAGCSVSGTREWKPCGSAARAGLMN